MICHDKFHDKIFVKCRFIDENITFITHAINA